MYVFYKKKFLLPKTRPEDNLKVSRIFQAILDFEPSLVKHFASIESKTRFFNAIVSLTLITK